MGREGNLLCVWAAGLNTVDDLLNGVYAADKAYAIALLVVHAVELEVTNLLQRGNLGWRKGQYHDA